MVHGDVRSKTRQPLFERARRELEARGREIYGDQWEEGVEGGVPLNVLFTLDDEDINAARNAAVGSLSVGNEGNAEHEGAAALLSALQDGGSRL